MEIVDDVGSLGLFRFPREGHLRARHKGRRLGQELVEIVVGPIAALRLHCVRIIEPGDRALRAPDDAIQRRTDLDRAAFFEGMAGLADLGVGLTLADVGLGQLDGERRLGRGRSNGRGRLAGAGEGVAGLQGSVWRVDRVGKDAQCHRAEQDAQHRKGELVAIRCFHTRASLGSESSRRSRDAPPRRRLD